MVINTQQSNQPDPTLLHHTSRGLPRTSGEGVRASDGGGDLSLPAPRGEVPAQQAEGSSPHHHSVSQIPQRRYKESVDEVDGGGLPPNPDPQSLTTDPPLPRLTDALLEDLLNPSVGVLDLCNFHEISLAQLDDIINSEEFHIAKRTIESVSRARRELMQPEAETLALARMTDLLKDKPETEKHAETTRKAAATLLRLTSRGLPRTSGGGAERSEAEGVPRKPSTGGTGVPPVHAQVAQANRATQPPSTPTRLPRTSWEGVRAAGEGGDLSLPAPRGEVPAQQAEGSSPRLPRACGGGVTRSVTEGASSSAHLSQTSEAAATPTIGKAACQHHPPGRPSLSI